MKLNRDLREFIELLNSNGIDYLVVGGYAVAFYGAPRFTGDIDFLVRPIPENAAAMLRSTSSDLVGWASPPMTS